MLDSERALKIQSQNAHAFMHLLVSNRKKEVFVSVQE